MYKVFIDGHNGTTGLKIYDRLKNRQDITLLSIDEDKRKSLDERANVINSSDFSILCLPDAASKEIVEYIDNPETVIIDASTAHRTCTGWAYGFPELDSSYRNRIETSKRIAVPGCYASGFISLVFPLVKNQIISPDCDVHCFAFSGYTGAGKKGIAQYYDKNRYKDLDSARIYGLSQEHKHLKEMKAIPGLTKEPCFIPTICDFPQGMLVSITLHKSQLNKKFRISDFWDMYNSHYKSSNIVKVRRQGYSELMIGSNNMANRDDMEIEVNGNDDRILLTSRFDNLGKGASGSAIQCLNISMGIDEETGLNIGE